MTMLSFVWLTAAFAFSAGWIGRSWVEYRRDERAMQRAKRRHPGFPPAGTVWLDPPPMPQWLQDHLGRGEW